jgi:hypothetical protein
VKESHLQTAIMALAMLAFFALAHSLALLLD